MVYFLCKTTAVDAIPGKETVGGSWLSETIERPNIAESNARERPDRGRCNGRGNGYDRG
jgi:hypothetical protein